MSKTDKTQKSLTARSALTRSTLATRRRSVQRATQRRSVYHAKTASVAGRRAAAQTATAKPTKTTARNRRHWSGRIFQLCKLLLIPHRHNDYRPHLVRRYGLLAILLLSLALNFGYLALRSEQILGDNSDITANQLLGQTNTARTRDGLSPLNDNQALAMAAQAKADDMLAKDYWSHTAPDGTTPWDWIKQTGYQYTEAGENLARGFDTTAGIVRAWLESPSHRANLLDAGYTEVGFAVVRGDMNHQATTLVVAMYGRPIGAPNASGEVASAVTKTGAIEPNNLWTHLRRGLHDLTPSLIFTLVLLGIATCVALLAHFYRRRLPVQLSRTWYRHHALIKMCFIAVLAVGAILSYGGGMI